MSTVNTSKAPVKFKENQLKQKVKLVLNDAFIAQVELLHKTIGAIEWSGPLIFKVTKGSIEDLSTFELEAVEVVPTDIGTSTYTEFDFFSGDEYVDDKVMAAMEDPDLKVGGIHTHHNMNCFFSGTDTTALHENAPSYNYYLSLIVNFKDYTNWCGKIAYISKKTIKGSITEEFKGSNGIVKIDEKTVDTIEEILNLVDLDIVMYKPEIELPTEFKDRVASLWKEHNKPKKVVYGGQRSFFEDDYSGIYPTLFDDDKPHKYHTPVKLKSNKTGKSVTVNRWSTNKVVPLTEANIKTFLAQLLSFDKSINDFDDVMKSLMDELDDDTDPTADSSKVFILDYYKSSFDHEFEEYFGYEPTNKSYTHVSAILGKLSLEYVNSKFVDDLLAETRKLITLNVY
jgi:proteasome lid subunit RPN8/RPN11